MSLDIVKLNSLEPPLKVKEDVEKIYDELVQEYKGKYKGVKNRLAGKFSKEKKSEKTKFINSIKFHLEGFAKAKAYYSISKQFCTTIGMYCESLCSMLKNLGVKPPKIPNEILSNSGKHILSNYTGCKEKLEELSKLVNKKFGNTTKVEQEFKAAEGKLLEITEYVDISASEVKKKIDVLKDLTNFESLNKSLEALVKGYDQYLKKGAIKTLEDALEYSRTRLNEIVCHLNSRVIEWEVADSQLLSLIICLEKICAKAKEYPNKQDDINAKLKKLNETLKQREKFCQTLDTIYVFDNNMGVNIENARDDLGNLQKTKYGKNINSESLSCLKILTEKKFDSQYKHSDSEWVNGPYYVLVDSNSQLIKDGCQQGAVVTTGTINRSSTSPDAENEVLRFLQVSVLKGAWAKKGEYEDKKAVIKYLDELNSQIK